MITFGFLANAGIAGDPPDGAMSKSLATEIAVVNAGGRSANNALVGIIVRGLQRWRRVFE
jgi:hypothetical protein